MENAAMISSTKQLINNYAISVSLTKDMQTEVNKSFNELYILYLIYMQSPENIRNIINKQILVVQKRVMEATKQSSGLFSRFVSGWQSNKPPTSLSSVWVKLAEVEGIESYKCLIRDMAEKQKE